MPALPLQTIDKAVLTAAAKLANLPEDAGAADINAAVQPVSKQMRSTTALRWNPVTAHPALLAAVHDDLRFLRQSIEELRSNQAVSDRAKWQGLLNSAGASWVLSRRPVPAMTGIASVVGYALVLLTDRADLFARFGRCKKCGKFFFVAPHSGRGRFRTDFCSTAHARTWAQLEYLKRQKAAKHK